MGIRGLTTFIREHSYKYLESYQLRDTYLLIDGNNLASHLYLWHTNCYDCFGGDYDKYARVIEHFFDLLRQCNVTPLVILDGGYENKKLATIYSRVRSSINVAGRLNSLTEGRCKVFPLFTRDLFVDILLRLNVKMVRCDFEADMEMASMAHILNCPILSYDSDFYVLDVLYIPFNTMKLKLEKCNKNDTVYNYISCQIYYVDKFLKHHGGLKKEVLPLLATVLGNDYIKITVFEAFYKHIKLPKRKHTRTGQQRKIHAVTTWLKTETYESGVRKILSRVKQNERQFIYNEIKKIREIYTCEESKYLDLLDVKYEVHSKEEENQDVLNLDEIQAEEECVTNEEWEDHDSASEESETFSLNELPLEEDNEYNLPEWFIDNYRRCWYPSCFMDIAVRNTYFFKPQLEDYLNETSHNVSLEILKAYHKILSYGSKRQLIYLARNGKALRRTYASAYVGILPALDDIPSMSTTDSQYHLLKILELSHLDFDGIPDTWKLFYITIIYWVESCKSLVNQSHLYALCLGMFLVHVVDKKIGYCRNKFKINKSFNLNAKSKVTNKKMDSLSNEIEPVGSEGVPAPAQFDETIEQIATIDCVSILRDMINYFVMDEKLQRNHRNYDIKIVDIYARYQSCFYFIKYLNILLNRPYNDIVISDYYNGTFLYNLCGNLMKRTDLDNYINIFLKDSPTILKSFQCFITSIKRNVSYEMKKLNVKKRRKRKNKKPINIDKPVHEDTVETEDELHDVNNRFNVLKFQ